MRREVQTALDGPSGLDDSGRITAIRALEELARTVSAAQAALAAELADSVEAVGLARVVRRELPHTWAAWLAGRITEWRATLIARETACPSLQHRLAVDEAVAADHHALEAMSDRQVVASAQAVANRLDGVFVLQVDRTTLEQRPARRTGDEWGADPAERALVLRLHETGEDVPDGIAIDAVRPLADVVDEIVRRAGTGTLEP